MSPTELDADAMAHRRESRLFQQSERTRSCKSGPEKLAQGAGCQRHALDAHTRAARRVLDSRGDDRGNRQRARFTNALGTERVQRGWCLEVVDLDRRYVVAPRQRVVHEARGKRLAGPVVLDLFVEGTADPERHRTVDLSLHDGRVDEPA